MNRPDFTLKICQLILEMNRQGEQPLIDYCKRSDEEQRRLFNAGLSKCDGKAKRSAHQSGLAVDIYFQNLNALSDPLRGWEYWHQVWEGWGGKPELLDENGKPWDRGHFEA